MPAIDAHRLFLSTVTSELGRYRTELAARFDRVSVKAVYQEEFEYADTDLVEKLYTLIEPCDVVIHFVGAGAGAKANAKAVGDFLECCDRRGQDFLGYLRKEHGLEREVFDRLTYTQWEAVIALFLGKHFMAVRPSGPVTDGHPADKKPFAPSAADNVSQEQHLSWLTGTVRRHPQMLTERDGSYLEDAFEKITGFLLRLGNDWKTTASRLQPQHAPPLGDQVAQSACTINELESQTSDPNGASGLQFGHTSCASFFHTRFVSAFPGVRREVRWIHETECIIERLERLLRPPLKYPGIAPIWWFRGGRCNSIDSFRVLDNQTVLINNDEMLISKMAGVELGNYWNSFVYLEAKPVEPSGIYPRSEDWISHSLANSGYAREEVGLYRGKYIDRKFVDDGAAEIDGRIIDLNGDAEVRGRFLAPYNLLIAGNDSAINARGFEREQERLLNEVIEYPEKFGVLVDCVKRLRKQVRYNV